MKLVRSEGRNPFEHLAIEEALLEGSAGSDMALFLCRNRPCVVIGKHQNPWKECDLAEMEADGVDLARRISGGGAVYHDAGNLNLSITMDRSEYKREHVFEFMIEVLAGLGVQAEREGSSSLVVDGCKVSGQAFCYRRERVLHHATLLFDTDVQRMNRYLRRTVGFETHAVDSVPATVANLPIEMDAAISAFAERCDGELPAPAFDHAGLQEWEWVYGKTPKFVYEGERIEAGIITESPNPARISGRFGL